MPQARRKLIQASRKALHALKVTVVAVICLLIGVCARQLFDAYAKEKIPFLREKDAESEVYVILSPSQEASPTPGPVESRVPHWN